MNESPRYAPRPRLFSTTKRLSSPGRRRACRSACCAISSPHERPGAVACRCSGKPTRREGEPMSSQPSGKVRCTWIEVRGASRADPGEIALVYYVVEDANVVLTDAQGQRRKDTDDRSASARIAPGEDAAILYEKALIV